MTEPDPDDGDGRTRGQLTRSLGRLGCLALLVAFFAGWRALRPGPARPDPPPEAWPASVGSPAEMLAPNWENRRIVEEVQAGHPTAAEVWVHSLRDPDAAFDGIPPLYAAASQGYLSLCFSLLERGAKVDVRTQATSQTPLIGAALGGHPEVIEMLLDRGADPEARSSLGRTALGEASFHGHLAVVQALLARGAKPDAQDAAGGTPLIFAAVADQVPAVEALLRAGAQVDLADQEGHTPLMVAVLRGRVAAARALLAGGADPLRATGGKSARDLAAESASPELATLLEGAVAAVASPGGR